MSWLWKGDANSPASFEKALSKLSLQITAANQALDASRSRSRRVKALWTLYTTLTYLLYTLVILLVLGPQAWSRYHYAGLTGAPLVIYAVRRVLAAFFDWRVGRQQAYLEHLQAQRESKIADLKRATKYDSTQELLQKYGGVPRPRTPSKEPKQAAKRRPKDDQTPPQRTGLPPPPTANIPGRHLLPSPPSPPPPPPHHPSEASRPPSLPASPVVDLSPGAPEFAPNAFAPAPAAAAAYQQPSHWYDRVLDVLLGEDETAAKNRLALLCSTCRLVNGQAPPGVKSLEEVGRWRCSSCGAWNGVDRDRDGGGARVVRDVVTAASKASNGDGDAWEKVPCAADLDDEDEGGDGAEAEASPTTDLLNAGPERSTGRDGGDKGRLTRRGKRAAGQKRAASTATPDE